MWGYLNGPEGSAVLTGTLLKCSTIFLSEARLQLWEQLWNAVPSHSVTALDQGISD